MSYLNICWELIFWEDKIARLEIRYGLFFSRNDAKTVNVITTACFSKVTKVRTEITHTLDVTLATFFMWM